MSNLSIELKLGDNDIASDAGKLVISSIKVDRKVNRIPVAVIQFIDPDERLIKHKIALGTKLDLLVEQQGAKVRFSGGIVKIDTEITEDGEIITVTLKTGVNGLTQHFSKRVFAFGEGENEVYPFFQNNTSDWDFLVCLADMYSAWVVQNGDDVVFLKEKTFAQGDMVYTQSLSDFSVDVGSDGEGKYELKSKLTAAAAEKVALNLPNNGDIEGYPAILNNASKSKIISITHTEGAGGNYKELFYHNEAGNKLSTPLSGGYIPAGIKSKEIEIDHFWPDLLPQSMGEQSKVSPEVIAHAREWKMRHGISQGKMTLVNSDLVDTGNYGEDGDKAVNLHLGRKLLVGRGLKNLLFFDGKGNDNHSLLTAISHNITEEGWETTLEWGASTKFHIEEFPDIQRSPTLSMLPSVQGIHIGVVCSKSGANEGAVKVHLFNAGLQMVCQKMMVDTTYDNFEGERWDWPRYEENDLVFISFTANDPLQGVVLGGLKVPVKGEENNNNDAVNPDDVEIFV